jgi:hypothetical protein
MVEVVETETRWSYEQIANAVQYSGLLTRRLP